MILATISVLLLFTSCAIAGNAPPSPFASSRGKMMQLLGGGIDESSSPFTSSTPEILVENDSVHYMSPRWAPCGKHIAFTSGGYRGIWTVSADGNDVQLITDEESAGYGFNWSSDGSAIVYRPVRYDEKKYRLHAIKLFNMGTGTGNILIDYSPEPLGTPRWIDHDRYVIAPIQDSLNVLATGRKSGKDQKMEKGQGQEKEPGMERCQEMEQDQGLETDQEPETPQKPATDVVYLARDHHIEKIALPSQRSEILREFEEQRILNLKPSPDRSRLAFQTMGERLFVMDSDGGNLQKLGRGEQPVWSPDGSCVFVTVSRDDGHHITGSEIYAIDIGSGERHHLTSHTDIIAINPSIDPEGKRMVFSAYNSGRIYIMTIR